MTCAAPATSDHTSSSPDPASAAARGRLGSILNYQWRLDSVLGVGGSAAVYAATHVSGKRAAIKLLHAEYAFDERLRVRIEREARVLSTIDHPCAVRLLDDGVTPEGVQFLVMELLDGETLASYLTRRGERVDLHEALLITKLVLDALIAVHQKGVVHRDISVENLFITIDGQVKLIDFGISRLLSVPDLHIEGTTNPVLGTPGFMPPEQARGQNNEVDQRSDVWAVGAVLFELLTGMPVHHEAQTLYHKLFSAAWKPAPKLVSLVPSASVGLQALVDRALAFDKNRRFFDARHMLQALRALLAELPEGAGARTLDVTAAPPVTDGSDLRFPTTPLTVVYSKRRPVERARDAVAIAFRMLKDAVTQLTRLRLPESLRRRVAGPFLARRQLVR